MPARASRCSFYECIQLFVEGDTTSGWTCLECQNSNGATKRLDIWRLPPAVTALFWMLLTSRAAAQVRITDLPCVQRLNQLYCDDQGTMYPAERIDHFIELNKALTLRMFGEASISDVTVSSFPPNTTSQIESVHTGVFPSYLPRETRRDRRATNATVAPPVAGNQTTPEEAVPSPPEIQVSSQHR
ncbi:Protein spaetzle 3 [Amphibalanus amphitrite]|uniref:Protein spaetzle 3 n=1 Tax=Amphibalanus amphitrite TaxID=1232801 RepID=A0A6A4V2N2_AMPAM|nr:Protein spaetzle 3 [Amphibalanus amphitrite]